MFSTKNGEPPASAVLFSFPLGFAFSYTEKFAQWSVFRLAWGTCDHESSGDMAALFSVQGTIQLTSFCHPVNDSYFFFPLEVWPFNFSHHRWIMKSERKWTAVLLNRRVRTSKPTVWLLRSPLQKPGVLSPINAFAERPAAALVYSLAPKNGQKKHILGSQKVHSTSGPARAPHNCVQLLIQLPVWLPRFFFSRAATSPGWLTAPPVSGAFYCTSNLQPLSLPQAPQLPLGGILSLWSLAFLVAIGMKLPGPPSISVSGKK